MKREEAATMMNALLVEYGLYQQGWRFNWMNRRNTYGLCRYTPKLVQLSTLFVDHNDVSKVLEVCRHEVAHALTPGARHGEEWRAVAIQLGVVDPKPCTEGAALPPARYQASCPSCSRLYSKTRPPKISGTDGRFYYCRTCWAMPSLRGMKPAERRQFTELKYVDTMSEKLVSAPVSASQSAPSVSLHESDDRAPETHTELLPGERVTAPELAIAMGVDPKKLRAWLRKWEISSRYQTGEGGSYSFNRDDVVDVVRAWNATH